MKSSRRFKKTKEQNKVSSCKDEDKFSPKNQKKLDDMLLNNKTIESPPGNQDSIKNDLLTLSNHTEEGFNKSNPSIDSIDNIHSEEEKKEKECPNNLKLLKEESFRRLNFEKLIESDEFAEKFILCPSKNNINNGNNRMIYSKPFDDNILLKDESLFFVFDNNYKNKFLSEKEIMDMKKENVDLNFGKNPYDIFKQISDNNQQPNDKDIIEFNNSLNLFNVFKNRVPMEIIPQEDNNDNGSGNNSNDISQSSTRNHSKCKIEKGENERASLMIEDRNLILNNENNFSEEQENLDDNDIMDNKSIGKKRKRERKK
jgi:hypothetical protein